MVKWLITSPLHAYNIIYKQLVVEQKGLSRTEIDDLVIGYMHKTKRDETFKPYFGRGHTQSGLIKIKT